jgi:hypothetical protein
MARRHREVGEELESHLEERVADPAPEQPPARRSLRYC